MKTHICIANLNTNKISLRKTLSILLKIIYSAAFYDFFFVDVNRSSAVYMNNKCTIKAPNDRKSHPKYHFTDPSIPDPFQSLLFLVV